MDYFPSTRWSLIQRVQKDRDAVFNDLFKIYRNPILRAAKKAGLKQEDAEEIAQDVCQVLCNVEELAACDPAKGKFRNWIKKITKHTIMGFWDKQNALKRGGGEKVVELNPAIHQPVAEGVDDATAEIDRDWVLSILHLSLEEMAKDSTEGVRAREFSALTLSFLKGRTHKDIAAEQGCTEQDVGNDVYRAKLRLKQRILAHVDRSSFSPEDAEDNYMLLCRISGIS